VLRILTAAIYAVVGPRQILADPKPKARIRGVSTIGVEYKVKYFIDCARIGPGKARHLVNKSVLDHMYSAGLSLAHQQQDVYYAPLLERQLDATSQEDRVKLLRRIDLFAPLDDANLNQLASAMRSSLQRQSSKIVRQGEAGDAM
jgi:hypothetical protein